MHIWRELSYVAMGVSLVSLGTAHVSWLTSTPFGGFSPRAFALGAAIMLLYAIAFALYDLVHRRP